MAVSLIGKSRLKLWRKTSLEQKIEKEEIGMLGEETEGVEERKLHRCMSLALACMKLRLPGCETDTDAYQCHSCDSWADTNPHTVLLISCNAASIWPNLSTMHLLGVSHFGSQLM